MLKEASAAAQVGLWPKQAANVAVWVDADLRSGTPTLGFSGWGAAGWGFVGDGDGDKSLLDGVLGVVAGVRAD